MNLLDDGRGDLFHFDDQFLETLKRSRGDLGTLVLPVVSRELAGQPFDRGGGLCGTGDELNNAIVRVPKGGIGQLDLGRGYGEVDGIESRALREFTDVLSQCEKAHCAYARRPGRVLLDGPGVTSQLFTGLGIGDRRVRRFCLLGPTLHFEREQIVV